MLLPEVGLPGGHSPGARSESRAPPAKSTRLLGSPKIAAPQLARLVRLVEGPFASACETHADALAARDGPRLDRAAESFEAMGAKLLAAEAAVEAAAAYRGEGKKGSMLTAAGHARRLLEECKGAHTPALSGLAPDPLTPREREVAMLAAGDLTSAEIGRASCRERVLPTV